MEEKYIFDGHEATVIVPEKVAEGRPWVWRAEFLGDFDYVNRALLEKGWHIAYYKISDMFGCPEAVGLMKNFRDDVIKRYSLNAKADIFGFSRGGLYSANYTLKFPEDISTLYLDAPVLDICSWPAGFGKGRGSQHDWEMCRRIYDLTDENAGQFKGSPIYHLQELIDTKVPVLLVMGDSDKTVPYDENGLIMAREYEKQGAKIKVVIKKGVGHHPHSLEEPSELVSYIISNRCF